MSEISDILDQTLDAKSLPQVFYQPESLTEKARKEQSCDVKNLEM